LPISMSAFLKGLLVKSETDVTKKVSLEVDSSATTGTQTSLKAAQTANRTVTLPDATDTIVARTTTDTLSNKTLDNSTVLTVKDSNLTLQDNGDVTKQAKLELSGITTGQTRTLTVPDASTTLMGTDTVQNVSWKVLDNTNSLTVKDTNLIIQDDGDTTKQVKFEASGLTTGTTRTITVPDANITLVGNANTATIQNKTLDNTNTITVKDANLTIQDDGDTTKQVKFELSGLTTGNTRTVTVPDASLTMVGTATTQTLTNKTLSGNTATNLVNGSGTLNVNSTGTITVPNATDTLVGKSTTDTLANKTLDNTTVESIKDVNLTIQNSSDTTKRFKFDASGIATGTTRLVTLPDTDITVVGTLATQTLQNKTLDNTTALTIKDTQFTLQNQTDITKQVRFNLGFLTTGNVRSYIMPDANTSLVGTDVSQILTNKDIDGGTATNSSRITLPKATKSTLDALTRKAGTVVYATDNAKIYYDNGSVLSAVGAGGAGAKNYLGTINNVDNGGDFESGSVGNWVLGNCSSISSASIPLTAPTFGSGASGNLSRTIVSSGQLGGTYSLSYASSATNVQGDLLASPAFTIDSEDQAKALTIKYYYKVVSGSPTMSGTANNTFGVFIWDVTNSAWIVPAGSFSMNQLSGVGIATATFQTPSNGSQFRLCVVNSGNLATGGFTLYLDDFFVGPQTAPLGPALGDWGNVNYTLTQSLSTNSGTTYKMRRVGDSLEVQGVTIFSGTNTQAGVATLTLSTVSIDSTKLSSGSRPLVGNWTYRVAASGAVFNGGIEYTGSATALELTTIQGSTNTPATIASSDSISFTFTVPIVGWSSNLVMSNDTDTRVVAASASAPTSGSITSAAWADITGYTAGNDTHGAFSTSTGVYTVPVTGWYSVQAGVEMIGTGVAGATEGIRIVANGGAIAANAPRIPTVNTAAAYNAAITTYLNAGATIKAQRYTDRTTATYTTASVAPTFSVSRVSGPSVVAATESVNALYTGNPPTGTLTTAFNTTTFGTKVKDSHNAYSGGTYTVPVSGTYDISASTSQSATYAINKQGITGIAINGTTLYKGVQTAGGANIILFPLVSIKGIPLVAGDLVTIKSYNDATTPTFAADATTNYFSIARIGN
jgi:hypothetical protein